MKAKWMVKSRYTTRKEAEEYYANIEENSEDFDIPEFDDVEISVIRKNNKYGKNFYGRGGLDKIILFTNDEDYIKEEIEWCKQVAKTICDALNEKGL